MTNSKIAQHRETIIASCDKYNEIGPLEDGFQYFWIRGRGALSAADLRVIADELDRRNKEWQDQIDLMHMTDNEVLSDDL